jgi:hypothetical protein
MHILTITVTNSNDPSCQRMKLTKRFEIGGLENPAPFVRECIQYTEDQFRQIFPRGMTYVVPYTEVDVEEVAESEESYLLKTAYASGQLQGTMIGERIEKHFGVPYHHPSMDTSPDTPLLSESLGGHKS